MSFIESMARDADDPRVLTYDTQAVRDLTGDVRTAAEDALSARVRAGDWKAFEPAAELKLAHLAPDLERAAQSASAWVRACALRALFALRGDPLPTGTTTDPILQGLDAYALKTSTRPEAIPALLGLLRDPSVIARVHASEGLVEKLGLTPFQAQRPSPLQRLSMAIASRLPSVWQRAASELHALLGAVSRGHDPIALDLVYRPGPHPDVVQRFWAHAQVWEPFDVATLRLLDGHDRAWVESVLNGRLASADHHAATALAELAPSGWRAALEDAALSVGDRDATFTRLCRDLIA